jgi:hypothetical protein
MDTTTSPKIISQTEIEETEEVTVKSTNVASNQIEIFDFAVTTYKKMKELGIITITQNSGEMQLLTKKETYKLTTHIINNTSFLKFDKCNPGGLSNKKSNGLTVPSIKMGQLLHCLFLQINKVPNPAPMMNISKFDNPEVYNRTLLRKLEKDVDLSNDDDFLNVNEFSSLGQKDCTAGIILEVDLLKTNEESDFEAQKEEAIRKLSHKIGEIYDEIVEIHVEEEIKRRKRFRFYVDILSIYRKIEIYCCLYKSRSKGKTIKNQTTKKIIKYCNNTHVTAKELKTILRAARRIENLLKIANNNWSIIDAFPNVTINFFRSTINVHHYEIWLKIVETGKIISDEEGKSIYLSKKQEEIKSRKDTLTYIYQQANINYSEVISEINWEVEFVF